MPRIARTTTDVLLGEAVSGTLQERYDDLMGVASVIANRARLYGVSPESVISGRKQFDAYGKALPAGVERYRDMAERAWKDVMENGPIHGATYFATPNRVRNLPPGLNPVTETAGHRYFTDPNYAPIATRDGVRRAVPEAVAELQAFIEPTAYAAVPETAPAQTAIDEVMGGSPPEDIPSVGVPAGTVNELGVTETDGYTSPFGAMGDRITSDYGSRDRPKTSLGLGSSFHRGVDMSLEPGASGYPAEAAAGGVVKDISYSPDGFGLSVEVQHPDGNVSSYSHLQEVAGNIGIGSQIARGTPVGLVGNSGNSQASHLHFGMTDPTGASIDPQSVVGLDNQPSVPTPQSSPISAPVASLGAADFDGGRFADAAPPQGIDSLRAGLETQQARMSPNIDTARFGPADAAPADGMEELRSMLEGKNAAATAQATPDIASPSLGLVSAANAADLPTGPSTADIAAQYGLYGAGKVSPEQNLADDVMAQRLSTKQARLPDLEPARVVETRPIATQPLTGSIEPSAFAAETKIDPTPTAAAVASPAKESLKSKDPNFGMPSAGQRMKDSIFNSKTAGSLVGSAIGTLLAGPVGAVALGKVGGKVADKHLGDKVPSETPLQALFNIMTGRNQNVFPERPEPHPDGNGATRISYDQLDEDGRTAYGKSRQFRDAVDKGTVGLY